MAHRGEVLSLYRTLLRSAHSFKDYNFRAYFQRRIKEEFHANAKSPLQKEALAELLATGRHELEVLRRQAAISAMYTTERSVLEA